MAAATQTAVLTTATLLYTSAGCRRKVAVRTKASDGLVFLSTTAAVTSSTGFPIRDTDPPLIVDLAENESLYGICAAATTATACVMPL